MNNDKLTKIYAQLNSLNTSLFAHRNETIINDGSWKNFNETMSILSNELNDDYFKKQTAEQLDDGRGGYVLVPSYTSKVYAATNYLHELYLSEGTAPPKIPNDNPINDNSQQHLSINQTLDNNQTQRMEVNVEFNQTIQYITEQLFKSSSEYKEGSNEKKFIDKIKTILGTTKSTIEIIRMIAAAAAEFGITSHTLAQIFQ